MEDLLAPYQQNNLGDCPPQYLQFVDCTDEVLREWKEGVTSAFLTPSGQYLSLDLQTLAIQGPDGSLDVLVPSGAVEVKTSYPMVYPSLDAFAWRRWGYKNVNGRYGYYENPNAKWDWYQIGGRYSGMLVVKSDAWYQQGSPDPWLTTPLPPAPPGYRRVDAARLADIQWDHMRHLRFLELAQRLRPQDSLDDLDLSGPEELDRYLRFFTYAVVTPDGVWHDQEQAASPDQWRSQFSNRFLRKADPDTILTIVDCHM